MWISVLSNQRSLTSVLAAEIWHSTFCHGDIKKVWLRKRLSSTILWGEAVGVCPITTTCTHCMAFSPEMPSLPEGERQVSQLALNFLSLFIQGCCRGSCYKGKGPGLCVMASKKWSFEQRGGHCWPSRWQPWQSNGPKVTARDSGKHWWRRNQVIIFQSSEERGMSVIRGLRFSNLLAVWPWVSCCDAQFSYLSSWEKW